ncbi:MAG: hypothetical protein P8Y71_18560 [Pseudolabrys sp.]|jgi:hypothetical protein
MPAAAAASFASTIDSNVSANIPDDAQQKLDRLSQLDKRTRAMRDGLGFG